MGRKRKGRCASKNTNAGAESEDLVQAPHSFVINKGIPDSNVLELTKDFRKVMEPFTASSLKTRKRNSIKDFVSIAGPLHVSHLSVLSRTDLGIYMKICRLPRGPTLTFKVHNYSFSRDVISSLKKQFVVEAAYKHSPLIVLNSFSGEGMQMKLMTSMFQNMFPTINLTNVDLNDVRRCVLLNYNPASKMIDFRHYAIKIVPIGISKGVKKIVQGKVPNLSKCGDISEYLTKSGLLSESEAEDDPTHHVTLAQKMISRGNMQSGRSSIKLSELGPRLNLQLIKIEDGLLDGEVLYHELVNKTEDEKDEIRKKREKKKKLKDKRKKLQDDNTKRKEDVKQELKQKSLKGMQKGKTETDIMMKRANKESNQELPPTEDDDAEYYRKEVGEEPDKDLFTSQQRGMKRTKTPFTYNNKKRKIDQNESDKRKPQHFKGGFKKFDKNAKGPRKSGRGVDKTNSHNRDHRPIGGKASKTFKTKSKRRK